MYLVALYSIILHHEVYSESNKLLNIFYHFQQFKFHISVKGWLMNLCPLLLPFSILKRNCLVTKQKISTESQLLNERMINTNKII